MSSRAAPVLPYDKFIDGRPKNQPFYGFCAMKIQAWWRMLPIRRNYIWHRFTLYHVAAMQIQFAWKATFVERRAPYATRTVGHDAATAAAARVIQTAWRSMADRQIYKYYRDLIAFRNIGDPALLLKAINPSEAALLDSAAGAHVRFRLGGDLFPPTIYYKIFVHNAVCDLGAFSPKDYQSVRRRRETHSKGSGRQKFLIRVGKRMVSANQSSSSSCDSSNWYQRVENNGWRPVTAKVVSEAKNDPVAMATSKKYIPFHYSKHKRREEIRVQKVKKKREWMQKMYQEGLLKDRMEHISNGRAAATDLNWEDDAEDLLQWSEALDFEKYADEWKCLGTSGQS